VANLRQADNPGIFLHGTTKTFVRMAGSRDPSSDIGTVILRNKYEQDLTIWKIPMLQLVMQCPTL
jgi:hypothetical protein